MDNLEFEMSGRHESVRIRVVQSHLMERAWRTQMSCETENSSVIDGTKEVWLIDIFFY